MVPRVIDTCLPPLSVCPSLSRRNVVVLVPRYSEDCDWVVCLAQPKPAAFTLPFSAATSLFDPRPLPLAHPDVLAAPAQTRLVFEVPSRGLMGFGAEIRQETHGSAVVNSTFV